MIEQTIRNAIFTVLHGIAPEVDPDELVADRPLRDQVDLDSIDWLNFIIGLHDALKVDIPEADYQKLHTLNDLVHYLQTKTPE